jgi:hypothetical protein
MRYFTLFSPFHLSLFFPFVASYLRFSYVLRQCLSFYKGNCYYFDNIHSFSPDSSARIVVSRKLENVLPGGARSRHTSQQNGLWILRSSQKGNGLLSERKWSSLHEILNTAKAAFELSVLVPARKLVINPKITCKKALN